MNIFSHSLRQLPLRSFLGCCLGGWAFFIVWVLLTPHHVGVLEANKITKKRLASIAKMLQKHVEVRGFSPFTLRELHLFAFEQGRTLNLYDGYEQRFSYHSLTLKEWLVRGFGAEGSENTLLSAPNPLAASSQQPLLAMASPQPPAVNYALSAYSQGAASPDGRLVARLYQHPLLHKSLLVVWEANHAGVAYMAFHDRVEEFLWLDDSTRLAFTATGSSTYQDGLYLWDLRTNKAPNLLNLTTASAPLGASISPESPTGWYLKLAAYSPLHKALYFWGKPKEAPLLDPGEFFAAAALRVFALSPGGSSYEEVSLDEAQSEEEFNFHPLLVPGYGLCQGGDELQKEWCSLPSGGHADKVLPPWQLFVENAMDSPLFASGAWVLAFLYHDAARTWRQIPPGMEVLAAAHEEGDASKTAEVLSSYGVELAQALIAYPGAAGWQRASARALWHALTSSADTLHFQLVKFDLSIPSQVQPPPP